MGLAFHFPQRFFPVETVVGVGEVKSVLTKEKLEKKSKRLEQLEQEKKQMEKHFLGRLVLGKYKK